MLKLDIRDELNNIESKAKEIYEMKTNNIKKEIGKLITTIIIMITNFIIMSVLIALISDETPITLMILISSGILITGVIGNGSFFVMLTMIMDIRWDKKYNRIHAQNGNWLILAFNYHIIGLHILSLSSIKELSNEEIIDYSFDFNSDKKLIITTKDNKYNIFIDNLQLPHNMEVSDMILRINNNKVSLMPI